MGFRKLILIYQFTHMGSFDIMIPLELWLSITAIVVSVASVVFVILEVGIRLGVGFREQEMTSARKDKIENALKAESDAELTAITDLVTSKKTSEKELKEELKERVFDLARIEYYGDFTKNLLDRMSTYNSTFLKGIAVSVLSVFATIAMWVLTFQDITSVNVYLLVATLAYTVMLAYSFRLTYLSVRNYYYLRDAFVKLSEMPSCSKCQEIDGSLEEKGISI